MTKESLLEKIKSLLALATGVGNENEKNLALKRAQELMAKYSIDLSSDNGEAKSLVEQTDYKTKLDLPVAIRDQRELSMLITPICTNFGVYVAYNRAGQVLLLGFKTNLEVAQYACETLLYQGIQDYKRLYRENRTLGFGISFWKGFKEGLSEKFRKEFIPESAMILYDKVKEVFCSKVSFESWKLNESNNASGLELGFQSARDAVLNKGIEANLSGRLLK